MHQFGWQRYLEDRDSPMKISFRLLMGRRLGLEKLSGSVPVPEKSDVTALEVEQVNKNINIHNDHVLNCLPTVVNLTLICIFYQVQTQQ